MGTRSVDEEVLRDFALWLLRQGRSEKRIEALLHLEAGTLSRWRGQTVKPPRHRLADISAVLERRWDEARVRRGCLLRQFPPPPAQPRDREDRTQ